MLYSLNFDQTKYWRKFQKCIDQKQPFKCGDIAQYLIHVGVLETIFSMILTFLKIVALSFIQVQQYGTSEYCEDAEFI